MLPKLRNSTSTLIPLAPNYLNLLIPPVGMREFFLLARSFFKVFKGPACTFRIGISPDFSGLKNIFEVNVASTLDAPLPPSKVSFPPLFIQIKTFSSSQFSMNFPRKSTLSILGFPHRIECAFTSPSINIFSQFFLIICSISLFKISQHSMNSFRDLFDEK
ncbi:uncharacterized protein LOC143264156 isoform X1 [Megachile rotundata]|uniref:uncharacterized protein LOC143264156 isoform X1 n=1 Tax=Megachile rotundata TaxID=143995 RepID=UPI003FCF7BA1